MVVAGLLAMAACGKSRNDAGPSPTPHDGPVAGHDGEAGATTIGEGGITAGGGGAGGAMPMLPLNDAGTGGEVPVVMNPVAPTYPGYELVLEEHFDAPLDLNGDAIWTWSDGGTRGGQVRYIEENISFRDGVMRILTSQPDTAIPASQSFAENTPELKSMAITSGELRTKFNNYRYGRYEARIKAPIPVPDARNQGNFVTQFLVSRTPLQEDYRQITFDLFGGRPDGLLTNVVNAPGIDSNESNKNYAVTHDLAPGFDTGEGFHTYAFVWKADSIAWYIDDALMAVRNYPLDNPGGPPVPEKSAKIALNTWVFNESYAFGGIDGHANHYPFTTEVDFIRFYKEDGEIYPCDAPPACLPPEDLNASKNNPKETDTEG